MLTIICRGILEDEVIALLRAVQVQGYTQVSKVMGEGKTGTVPGEHAWAELNSLFLVALSDEHVHELVSGLRSLHEQYMKERHGQEVPLKLFMQSCEMIL